MVLGKSHKEEDNHFEMIKDSKIILYNYDLTIKSQPDVINKNTRDLLTTSVL